MNVRAKSYRIRNSKRFILAVFVITLLYCLIALAQLGRSAQDVKLNTSDSTETTVNKGSSQEGWFEWFKIAIRGIPEIIAYLIAIGLAALVGFLRNSTNILRKELSGLMEPVQPGPDEIVKSVMVLGIGGVGKSTLIGKLTGDARLDPNISTREFDMFSVGTDLPANRPRTRCQLYFSDYQGQNLGGLIEGFIKQQREPHSVMRYGYISALLLVVDLVSPPELADKISHSVDIIDTDRVQYNLDMWNHQALSAVFGMLTRSLEYIFLFINKADLLPQSLDKTEEESEELYKSLREILTRYSRGAQFITFVGSAKTGTKVSDLKHYLLKRT